MRTIVVAPVTVAPGGSWAAAAQGSVPGAFGRPRAASTADLREGARKPEKFTACRRSLAGLIFARSGGLRTVGSQSGEVHRITPVGACETAASTGGQPRGPKVAREGEIVGSDRGIGSFAVAPETRRVTRIASDAGTFSGLNDRVLDAAGVTEASGNEVRPVRTKVDAAR